MVAPFQEDDHETEEGLRKEQELEEHLEEEEDEEEDLVKETSNYEEIHNDEEAPKADPSE